MSAFWIGLVVGMLVGALSGVGLAKLREKIAKA